MTRRTRLPVTLTAIVLALALSACGKKDSEDSLSKLDNELTGSVQDRQAQGADPALVSALENQIMVDPALSGPAAGKQVSSAPAPTRVEDCPQGGCLADGQLKAEACDKNFKRDPAWASRLPKGLPVYPGAKVTEAAGNDSGNCRVRIVSFASTDTPKKLVDYYFAAARRSGYSAEYQLRGSDHIVAGVRMPQGDAFHVTVTPRGDGGANADMIANHGS